MERRFHIDLLDPKTTKAVIKELKDYERHVLKNQADELARGIAGDVRQHTSDQSHVVTGRLKRTQRVARRKKGYYQVIIDPVAPGKEQFHYAQTEKTKGGEHDFTRDYKRVALVSLSKRKGNF